MTRNGSGEQIPKWKRINNVSKKRMSQNERGEPKTRNEIRAQIFVME